MNDLCGLYDEEDKELQDFIIQMKSNSIRQRDLVRFVDSYQDLLIQSKVITKVSDKLQSKLNKANERIKEQNEEIVEKNLLLENTVSQLVKARMGKKASTITFTVAVCLFLSEELFLGEAIAVFIQIQYLDLALKGSIAFGLKFLEGGLETFFMKKEQIKIVLENSNQRKGPAGYSLKQPKLPTSFDSLSLIK